MGCPVDGCKKANTLFIFSDSVIKYIRKEHEDIKKDMIAKLP